MYELKVLNKHDTDFRDMYFDQRITNDINNRYHKNFLLAQQCSNPDPLYFPNQVATFPDGGPVVSAPWNTYGPVCKPVIMIECADIRSAACNSTRKVLYDAVGLALVPGTPYVNCLLAGRVRVGAQAVPVGRPISLVAYYTNSNPSDALVIPNPFQINATLVYAFVDRTAQAVDPASVDYVQPSTQLGSGIYLDGVQVPTSLVQRTGRRRNVLSVPPWNVVSNLWPWPGMNARCQNTGANIVYQLSGSAAITIPRFAMASPQDAVITLTVANMSALIGAWRVAPAAPPSDELGGSTDVTVSYLSGIQVAIGQVVMAGACSGWQFSGDPNDVSLTYTNHWTGSVAALQAGATFGPFVGQTVNVRVADIAGPAPFKLPIYTGMYYIFNAFVMAFIWMVSNGLMLFIIILVWWNVRSNKGLPPIIYRYMQKYRGW